MTRLAGGDGETAKTPENRSVSSVSRISPSPTRPVPPGMLSSRFSRRACVFAVRENIAASHSRSASPLRVLGECVDRCVLRGRLAAQLAPVPLRLRIRVNHYGESLAGALISRAPSGSWPRL